MVPRLSGRSRWEARSRKSRACSGELKSVATSASPSSTSTVIRGASPLSSEIMYSGKGISPAISSAFWATSPAWNSPTPPSETISTKSAPESAKTSTELQSESSLGSRPERFSIPCAAAPAENSPASSLSENRALTFAPSPPTSVSWKTSLPSGSTSLKRGGLGRSSRVSSRPVSSIIRLSAYEFFGHSAREERGHGEGRETEEEQDPECRAERGCEGAGHLRVRPLRDAAANGRLQKGVGVGEQVPETRITPCCPVYGGPVTISEGSVQESAHHGDPDQASDGTEEDYRGGGHAATPPRNGVLHADEVTGTREAKPQPDHHNGQYDVGKRGSAIHRHAEGRPKCEQGRAEQERRAVPGEQEQPSADERSNGPPDGECSYGGASRDRGPAEGALHEERHVDRDAEQDAAHRHVTEGRDGDDPLREQVERNHGVFSLPLDEHEEREHGQPADEEPEGCHRELSGASTSEQREQHGDEAACKESCAEVVYAALATLEGLGQGRREEDGGDDAKGHVYVEDPAPGDQIRNEAAGCRTNYGRDPPHRTEEALDARPRFELEDVPY